MPSKNPDHERAQERVRAAVRVSLDGRTIGLTRDISPAGVVFDTDVDMTTGSSIQFALVFDNPEGELKLDCWGEVVRVEKAEEKNRVAIKILQSRLERFA